MSRLTRDRMKKNVFIGFPRSTMPHDSVLHASPIKEKKSPNVLRHESVHMLHLSNDVLKIVLLNGIMRRDSVQLPHQGFIDIFFIFSFLIFL
jgi:hypothetical protein